jgi:puromycin-sensitive aminopeptidase
MIRLDPRVRPEHYRLDLSVDPRNDRFAGQVEIRLSAPRATRTLELHAVDLDVEETRVEDGRGEVPVRRIAAKARRETLVLHLGRELDGGTVTLRMSYTGPLRADLRGLYLARSGRRRYAATQLEAADARRMFPCFDEPDKKARFTFSVTTPRRNTVLSNAPIAGESVSGPRKTVRFRETPPLSTYLMALVVGELEGSRTRRCGKTPIRVWHVPGKGHLTAFALEAAAESLARLERYFGLPYPYEKLDLIAVPDFEFGAMENAGAVTFRESLLLVDPATITLGERKRVAEVIAHELAHMWFGDLVTMAWWDDLWLNEAFATWMAFSIVDDWKPEWEMWLDFQHHRAAAFSLDGLVNTHPIYTSVDTPDEATENFDAITYEKGASVVRMIERWLGAPTFRRGVRRYIRQHREANAQAADLWSALEEASGERIAPVVRAWIERPGFPMVSARRSDRNGRASLELAQERYFASPRGQEEERKARWPIPAVVRVRPERGRARLERALLSKRRERIDLGPSGSVRWVYANADEGGFYRPLHSAELLEALGEDLFRLSASERMGLAGHQWAGVRADRAPLADFLNLIDRLGEEPRAEVLEAALGPLTYLVDEVGTRLSDADRERLSGWLRTRFGPAFQATGWDAAPREPDHVRARRQVLLRIAGGLGNDPEILSRVEPRIRAYLRDRKSLEPNLAAPLVELAARSGSKSLYQAYLRTMRRARTPQERSRFELGLAAFRDPALIEQTLELSLTDDVPTQDVVILLVRLLANPAARETTWSFVRERWSALSPRISTGLAPRLISALPALGTPAHRREVAAFFRAHPMPTASRALKQAMERFPLEAELRRRCAPQLRRWLRGERP